MLLKLLLIAALAHDVVGLVLPDQHVFASSINKDEVDLIYELHRAEIIPTVLDDFDPSIALSIAWDKAGATLGNTVSPSKVQEAPEIKLSRTPDKAGLAITKDLQLTVALTDPDAPSRDNPEWSQICHWIITGLSIDSESSDQDTVTILPFWGEDGFQRAGKDTTEEVMPYKPPGPPPKTGKHRYVFVVLAPSNGTKERLYLEKPGDRKHWGFDEERAGLREWAKENGLSVVGANFIYAQNKEQ